MRPRLLFVVLLAGSAWLFLTEGGRRRRDQALSLLGLARPGQGSGDEGAATPLPFPPPSARGGSHEDAPSPTPEDSASPAPDPEPAAFAPTPEAATPPEPAASAPAWPSAPPAEEPAPVAAAPSDGSAEGSPRLAEVLQELEDEMESHAIGQEPEVKVEDELDPSTLGEIGIPAAEAAPAEEQASPPEPAAEAAPSGPWIGNKRTMKAHPPGSGSHLPAEENRVEFATRAEVEAAGYTVVEREL